MPSATWKRPWMPLSFACRQRLGFTLGGASPATKPKSRWLPAPPPPGCTSLSRAPPPRAGRPRPPEARVHARRRIACDEAEEPLAPGPARRRLHFHVRVARDEAALRLFEVDRLVEGERGAELQVGCGAGGAPR